MPNLLQTPLLLLLMIFCPLSYADPWFTGPLLAFDGGATLPGHGDLQLYVNDTLSHAIYSDNWQQLSIPASSSLQFAPQFTYGLMDRIDVEWDFMYQENRFNGKTHHSVGDTMVTLGYQLFEQNEQPMGVDLRLALNTILPSGRYDNLNATDKGTDASGMGSYQTGIGVYIQNLSPIGRTHYLNTYLNLSCLYPSSVELHGINTYGGNRFTRGNLKPGNILTIDLASEFSLTQNWVAVLEGNFQYKQSDQFKGSIGTFDHRQAIPAHESARHNQQLNQGNRLNLFPSWHNLQGLNMDKPYIGNGVGDMFSLAPAVEYNFSEKYGIIVGCWFTVLGKNAPDFASLMTAFNVYW